MAALTVTAPTDLAIPDWLGQCPIADRNGNLLSEDDNNLICRAFEFAYLLHKGQYRKSGEPYIAHPVAVAGLLRDIGGDSAMIAAGFLHDVVEDTDVTIEEIGERFGSEVQQLVEAVTKLSGFNFSSKTERQAESFRRMFVAMAQDIRVILVKLADRLHNMRTLEALKPEKQKRIAQETRDIFAPLANRLGIWHFKWELEDLCFKYLETDAYRQVQELVAERRIDREQRIENVIEKLRSRLRELGINVWEIKGRPKHLYSIYQKMTNQQKEFHQIFDIAAIRIITQTKDECYRALAVVHDQFTPIPGRFKDYIGLPKPNRYQSLHTTVVGLTGRPLEVQIRTLEMHYIAEYGIAAHWVYKETGGSQMTQFTQSDEKFTWLRQLLEWQNDLKDAREYVECLKDNLFDDEVYVFTPKGDVMSLSRGATAVDFAYRIHTEIGNHMKGARINGRWSGLEQELKNGDIVDIITAKNSHPSLDWLNYAVTPSARNRIRQWYKRSHRNENLDRGRDLLEKELGKSNLETVLKSEPMQTVAERCNYHSVEDLLAALGYGEVTVNQVVNRLRDTVKTLQPLTPAVPEFPKANLALLRNAPLPTDSTSPIVGVEGLLYSIANCCNPIPGEAIIGVVTRSKGISIHRQGCCNLENIEAERLVPVSWNPLNAQARQQNYLVNLQIEAIDRVGIFKDILARLSDQNINVCNAGVRTSIGKPASIDLGIQIRDREQLETICNQIRKMSDILNLRRISSASEESVL
ncbi:bifunctional (p)ppGpp synthetase/guanosine-3',5'-bis(diphosphate) 3'-pyrophosphohydrolase [Oscillatoria sp. FACHB-1406]|uniref:RelA/SpoT family protein n=1 Tax=Oscillatoria sp. FACHB-1406 TaxID=2692846 RepID=UPI00168916C5|nr:bifunctional (p)ppGpp synthetase/guanosine-3',5'-bis(diphosphate) 3'-pyrophosphohydrolase [Oscillatoria sp. FACHB-1406]MBD2580021.1 bifunctional (p)ppGpp synthetase/guanosine-3',5'-bis(diphosphate) 3'-pyrophosphohydrolase [Oscillatoria sp. FACHB-1406]